MRIYPFVLSVFAALFVAAALAGAVYAGLVAHRLGLNGVLTVPAAIAFAVLKIILPMSEMGQRPGGIAGRIYWVALCALTSWTVISVAATAGDLPTVPQPIALLLSGGWIMIEVGAGVLPTLAIAAWQTPPTRLSPPSIAAPACTVSTPIAVGPAFANVQQLLKQAFSTGVGDLEGMEAVGTDAIFTSNAVLGRHAGCSKSEAWRQLQALKAAGMLDLSPSRTGTRIERRTNSVGRDGGTVHETDGNAAGGRMEHITPIPHPRGIPASTCLMNLRPPHADSGTTFLVVSSAAAA